MIQQQVQLLKTLAERRKRSLARTGTGLHTPWKKYQDLSDLWSDTMTNEQLVARIRAGENEAENMLVLWQQNKGFIHKMAIKYTAFAELEDLKQECHIGLCHAVEHFNADQDASFIHYAAFWMKQVMLRYIDNCCSSVRIPVHARGEIHQYKKIYGEYRKWYGKKADRT